jgi:hypothetical protein
VQRDATLSRLKIRFRLIVSAAGTTPRYRLFHAAPGRFSTNKNWFFGRIYLFFTLLNPAEAWGYRNSVFSDVAENNAASAKIDKCLRR